jgi:hypothetical protein
MLHITKKTASLHVDGADRSGVVYFDEGSIVNADVSLGGGPKSDPRDEVVEAVYVLELLDDGSFEIKNEVPPRTIEPLAVAEALELAGQHLNAERDLDETGLLAARGLRLAQTIEEPIILSEQVWNAISVSIPAFTFPELEERLGRAAAVATVEQFRDLGILEAVLEDVEPTLTEPIEPVATLEGGFGDPFGSGEEAGVQFAEADGESWIPPAPVSADDPSEHQVSEPEDGFAAALEAAGAAAHFPEQEIVPLNMDEVQPIIADAADDSIVVPDEQSEDALADSAPSGPTAVTSSLSAAIRAAAGAASSADDEAMLLSEAADGGHPEEGIGSDTSDGSLRRTVKSLVSPSSGGAFGDLSGRFRQAAAADSED